MKPLAYTYSKRSLLQHAVWFQEECIQADQKISNGIETKKHQNQETTILMFY